MTVAAIVLAAGTGSRFQASGGVAPSKVVSTFGGRPLVRIVAEAALASRARPVVVVTGHAADAVTAALDGLAVTSVHNADFRGGLAGSLKAGIGALPTEVTAAVILLGDMPLVGPALIDHLLQASIGDNTADAIVPVTGSQRGNPVLLSSTLFPLVSELQGDHGARHLLRKPNLKVLEISTDDDAATIDIDTVDALTRLAGHSG